MYLHATIRTNGICSFRQVCRIAKFHNGGKCTEELEYHTKQPVANAKEEDKLSLAENYQVHGDSIQQTQTKIKFIQTSEMQRDLHLAERYSSVEKPSVLATRSKKVVTTEEKIIMVNLKRISIKFEDD